MSFFTQMVQLQLELFLLMAIGFGSKKIKLLNDAAQKSLSDLLIYVILPANILNSFTNSVQVTPSLLQNFVLAFFISLAIQLAATYGGRWIFRKWPPEKAHVANYGLIVSNSSFMGIPVMERVYDSIGVVYTAVFQIPIRLTMWSAGLGLFTNVNGRQAFRKVVTHPCNIACLAGLCMMLLNWRIPGFVGDTVVGLSHCTGPLSMIVIGAILADAQVQALFQKDVLWFCLLRLVAMPLVVWGIMRLLGVDPVLTGVTVLLTAMPAGSTTAILPQKYDGDKAYGAALIFTSTLFSIATIPLLSLLLT